MEQTRLTANAIGPARKESFMGREFRVFPAVLVRSQVLNNNLGAAFLPAEEITPEWAASWNGAPVVIDHPSKRGAPVSARDPEVLNARGSGFVFRAKVEDGELKGDVFLDASRADDVEGLRAVMQKLEQGQPVELSTGFPLRAVENTEGTHDGKPFDLVMRPAGSDHLAIFADKTGACSVSDGCGLGVNCEGGEGCACEKADNEDPSRFTQAIDKLMVFLSRFGPAPIDEEGSMERDQMIAALSEAGPLTEDRLNEMEDTELQALHEKLVGDEGAEGAEGGEEGDPSEGSQNAADEVIAELKAKVERLEEAAQPAINEREEKRRGLVKALADNERCAFEEEDLEAMSVAQLEKLAQTAQVRNYAGRGGPRADATNDEPTHMPPKPYWVTNAEEN